MYRIASTRDLQVELRRLLAHSQEHQPSRQVLASELRDLADRVSAGSQHVAVNQSLKWGMFASACSVAGKELHQLAQEADAERRKAEGDEKGDIQKIFSAVKNGQLELDSAVIFANTLATKLGKAKK